MAAVTLTVHSWKNLQDTTRPACKIYLEGADGELASGVFTVPLRPAFQSTADPKQEAQTIQIHCPEESSSVGRGTPSLTLVVDVVEEAGSSGNGENQAGGFRNSLVSFTLGRIRLPVCFVDDWSGQQWHAVKEDAPPLESSAIELSGSVHRVANHIPGHIIDAEPAALAVNGLVASDLSHAAAVEIKEGAFLGKLRLGYVSRGLTHTGLVTAVVSGGGDGTGNKPGCAMLKQAATAAQMTREVSAPVEGSVPPGVRTFFDTISLSSIDAIDSFLIVAKDTWQSHGHDCPVDEVRLFCGSADLFHCQVDWVIYLKIKYLCSGNFSGTRNIRASC